MNVYFSGIAGVGLGPLAQIASDAGYTVFGSDPNKGALYVELEKHGASLSTDQSGDFLTQKHHDHVIDWFVHTSALPADHPELLQAKKLGIHTTKRDLFLSELIKEKELKLIAIAGTHGKTTTTGMIVWLFKHFNIPVSYSVGSTLTFGPSGQYDSASDYFIYECDEYDKNFLQFNPHLAAVPAYDYDHPDIYPTQKSYEDAFLQFFSQSKTIMLWDEDVQRLGGDLLARIDSVYPDKLLEEVITCTAETVPLADVPLAGMHNRRNGWLAASVFSWLNRYSLDEAVVTDIASSLGSFAGTGRRFEKLGDNLYSDYGHHPSEIAATIQMAREVNPHVVLVYQPHQNSRQHEVKDEYEHAFENLEKLYWLPTYLARENPDLEVLTPQQLIATMANSQIAEPAEMDDNLWENINQARLDGKLVLCMGAGTIDGWVRAQLKKLAGAKIILFDEQHNLIMQKRDNKEGVEAPGKLSFFGGRSENNEAPLETAVRELREETNVGFDETALVPYKTYKLGDYVTHVFTLNAVKTDSFIVKEGVGYEIMNLSNHNHQPEEFSNIARAILADLQKDEIPSS